MRRLLRRLLRGPASDPDHLPADGDPLRELAALTYGLRLIADRLDSAGRLIAEDIGHLERGAEDAHTVLLSIHDQARHLAASVGPEHGEAARALAERIGRLAHGGPGP